MLQFQNLNQYKKLKTIYNSPISKVQLIIMSQDYGSNENMNPNHKQQLNQQIMILKKYSKQESDKRGISALTEYQILKELKHQNIINFKQIFEEQNKTGKCGEICIIMDLMCPLHSVIDKLQQIHIQTVFASIAKALSHIHHQGYIHRDIKPSNILINENGIIKLSDFGISRKFQTQMTPNTCTKNYRAPELFFGSVNYDYSIDIWSLGCTLAEMFIGKILFDGIRETEILGNIASLIGDINETTMGDISKLPLFFQILTNKPSTNLWGLFKQFNVPEEAAQLIHEMLQFNPIKRPKIETIVNSSFVKNASNENYYLIKLANEYRNLQIKELKIKTNLLD